MGDHRPLVLVGQRDTLVIGHAQEFLLGRLAVGVMPHDPVGNHGEGARRVRARCHEPVAPWTSPVGWGVACADDFAEDRVGAVEASGRVQVIKPVPDPRMPRWSKSGCWAAECGHSAKAAIPKSPPVMNSENGCQRSLILRCLGARLEEVARVLAARAIGRGFAGAGRDEHTDPRVLGIWRVCLLEQGGARVCGRQRCVRVAGVNDDQHMR